MRRLINRVNGIFIDLGRSIYLNINNNDDLGGRVENYGKFPKL